MAGSIPVIQINTSAAVPVTRIDVSVGPARRLWTASEALIALRPVDTRPAQAHNGLTMISRIWHVWTIPANAEAYEALLKGEILVGIRDRRIAGYSGIQLLRRSLGDEVEFVTIMWFESMEAVRTFAGEDYEKAVVPPNARLLLSRFDERSQHYEVRTDMRD